MVRHTARGKDKDIPYLRCQSCQQVFASWQGTPLYYLKTKPERVEMVLWFLAEGVDLTVLVRYTGHRMRRSRGGWNGWGGTAKVCTMCCFVSWSWRWGSWMSCTRRYEIARKRRGCG